MLPHKPIDMMDSIGLEALCLQETINAITLAHLLYFCIIHLLKNKEEYIAIAYYRFFRIYEKFIEYIENSTAYS